MAKSIIGHDYTPNGCKAVDLETNKPADLGNKRKYTIIADPYLHKSRGFYGSEVSEGLYTVINVMDKATGRTYRVEFKPALLQDEQTEAEPAAKDTANVSSFIKEVHAFAESVKKRFEKNGDLSVSDCSFIVFALCKNGEKLDGVVTSFGDQQITFQNLKTVFSQSEQLRSMAQMAILAASIDGLKKR